MRNGRTKGSSRLHPYSAGGHSVRITLITSIAISLAACGSQSPADKQADTIEGQAKDQAQQIKVHAATEADQLSNLATTAEKNAEVAGGFTGERLHAQEKSFKTQAEIVERQGRARADAVKKMGEARAEAIRSR